MIKIGLRSGYFTAVSAGSRVYAFPSFTNCTTQSQLPTTYYSATPTITIDTVLYTNSQLTIVAANLSGVYLKELSLDNGVQINTNSLGAITGFARCVSEHTLYNSCGNAGGGGIYFTRFNDVLANGTVLYADANLTTPVNGSVLYLDNVSYLMNEQGVIALVGYCTASITAYSNCTDYRNNQSALTLYVRDVEYVNPLVAGTKVYSDAFGTNEINYSFVWNNNLYSYSGGATLSSYCNT
jgi:hypothetical protein